MSMSVNVINNSRVILCAQLEQLNHESQTHLHVHDVDAIVRHTWKINNDNVKTMMKNCGNWFIIKHGCQFELVKKESKTYTYWNTTPGLTPKQLLYGSLSGCYIGAPRWGIFKRKTLCFGSSLTRHMSVLILYESVSQWMRILLLTVRMTSPFAWLMFDQ